MRKQETIHWEECDHCGAKLTGGPMALYFGETMYDGSHVDIELGQRFGGDPVSPDFTDRAFCDIRCAGLWFEEHLRDILTPVHNRRMEKFERENQARKDAEDEPLENLEAASEILDRARGEGDDHFRLLVGESNTSYFKRTGWHLMADAPKDRKILVRVTEHDAGGPVVVQWSDHYSIHGEGGCWQVAGDPISQYASAHLGGWQEYPQDIEEAPVHDRAGEQHNERVAHGKD